MKTVFAFLTAALVFALPLAAEELTPAAKLYHEGRFAEALSAYENELKKYPNDPFVYYNIGNCYFEMGSAGLAAANYYRAFQLRPRDKEIRQNLSMALAAGGEKLYSEDIPPALHKMFFYLSYTELKGLTQALFWIWGLVCAYWILKRKGARAVVLLGLVLCVAGGWFYARHTIETETLAVVAAPVAELRSGPGKNFPASANIAQGHLVTVEDKKDNWYKVVVKSQSISGWMETSSLEKI
jgi:hypothetical protein